MKSIVLLSAAVFLFAVITVYLIQDKDTNTTLRFDNNSYMDDVSIIQKKKGTLQWIANAKKAVFLNNTDVMLSNLKIILPEKELILTSDKGLYDIESRDLKIEDNINAFTKDYEIVATKLHWDSSRGEIVSDERIQIKGKRFFIEGDALKSSADKAILNGNVKAVFYEK